MSFGTAGRSLCSVIINEQTAGGYLPKSEAEGFGER
jgi:hypothetical protein